MKKIILMFLVVIAFDVSAVTSSKSSKKKTSSKQNLEQKDIISANTGSNTQKASSGSSIKDFFAGDHPFQNEVLVNFSTGEFISQKACSDCSSTTTFTFFGSYLHHLKDNFQLGGEGGITSTSNTTFFDLAAVGTYNLANDFRNSIYAKVGLGLASVSGSAGSGSETKIGFFIGGGKRFAIFNNLTYSPELRIVKKGDLDVGFQATFFNLSVYWN